MNRKTFFKGVAATFVGMALGVYLNGIRQGQPIYTRLDQVPPMRVAIVLGASVQPDGRPTPILFNRVLAAVTLYNSRKVQKLLMSGARRRVTYDETSTMRALAMTMGVPSHDILLDPAGFRTYDSLFRARDVFDLHQVILVTQRYHLYRALYLARHLGITAVGWEAPTPPDGELWRVLREVAAIQLAWFDLHIGRRPHVMSSKQTVY